MGIALVQVGHCTTFLRWGILSVIATLARKLEVKWHDNHEKTIQEYPGIVCAAIVLRSSEVYPIVSRFALC